MGLVGERRMPSGNPSTLSRAIPYTDPCDLATSGVSETKPRVTMSPADMISYDTNIITVPTKRVNDANDRWSRFLWVHASMS